MKHQVIGMLLVIQSALPAFALAQSPLLNQFFSAEQQRQCNTAVEESDWTLKEQEALMLVNLSRVHPQQFAAFFRAYLQQEEPNAYKQKFLKRDRYYRSLFETLKRMKPAPVLHPAPFLQDLASCWAEEAGRTGIIGHNRVKCSYGYEAECCCYSYTDDPLVNVLELLVDEGVRSLGHRDNLLNPYFRYAGVAQRKHSRFGVNLVIDQASLPAPPEARAGQ